MHPMRTLLLCLFTLLCTRASAQTTDHDLVRNTVQAYIDGTSFNRPELLESSFGKHISMYFTKRGENWMPTRDEYIGFFRGKEVGSPTGRQGSIRLIEVAGDVATAKAEILIPAKQLLFIDYFLLKKIAGTWRIVSKTASSGPTHQHGGRVLMVVSNADRYGDSEISTGNHFGEIAAAYRTFADAGYTVDFTSPDGGKVPVTYLSSVDTTSAPLLRDPEFWYRLGHTQPTEEVAAGDYAAVYFPGGGAALFGVADDPAVQEIIRKVYEAEGAVAAVCHGTAGITSTNLSDGTPLLRGKQLTGFPDARERKDAPYYATFPFTIDKRVAKQGGNFQSDEPINSGFYLVDGRLVTGMDHSATVAVAKAVIEVLNKEQPDAQN